jgi:hypothetical protein
MAALAATLRQSITIADGLTMNRQQPPAQSDADLAPWTDLLEGLSAGAVNLTVGLISGSRIPNDRVALARLAEVGLSLDDGSSLLIRLNLGNEAISKRQLRTARASDQAPVPAVSPLGTWREVSIPMQLGATAPRNLEKLPRWLSTWKREYKRILVDLGPLDQPVCRAVGRYCDCCLLLLGPETCASSIWLRRHIDHLTQCDVTLSGSIVLSAVKPAVA